METFWLVIIIFIIFVVGFFIYNVISDTKKEQKKIDLERQKTGNKFYGSRNEKISYFVDTNPSTPENFGRKSTWLAIKSTDHEAIVKEFCSGKKEAFKTNMKHGVFGGYASHIFVFPAIDQWTLIINPALTISKESDIDYLIELSKKHSEVQFFGSYRGVDYSAWIKVIDSEIIRAYSVADGKNDFDIGQLSSLEDSFIQKALENAIDQEEIDWINGEGKLISISSEDNLLKMSEEWSINPDKLDQYKIEELGTIIGS